MNKSAPLLSFKNKNNLKDTVGCYYCQKVFQTEEIKEWTDRGETALCPFCHVDAVVPETNENILKEWYNQWLEKPKENFAKLSKKQ